MPAWDIDPVGVQGVIQSTANVAASFEGEFTSYGTAMQGSAENCASEIVGLALQGFSMAYMPDMEFIVQRTSACMTGAVNATNFYVQGDLEMAANAQSSATAAPDGSFTGARPGQAQ